MLSKRQRLSLAQTSFSTLLYCTTRCCTRSRRSTAALVRSSASDSIDGQIPSFHTSLPSGLVRPCDHSRFRFGTLATYTWVFGDAARRVCSASSKSARKSATEVIARAEDRQASFAPTITVTSSGPRAAAWDICSGRSAIRAPVTA